MPSNGKLLSDYTPEEWKRLRQSVISPSLGYWITVIALSFLLLLGGFFRLATDGFTYEAILFTGAGIISFLLLTINILYRLSKWRKK